VDLDVAHFPAGMTAALRADCVAVIDVLRSTTVIAHALASGAREIVPVTQPEEAFALAARIGRARAFLGGEAQSARIEGFDAGNSWNEYPRALVEGKSVILRTTNGTQALRALAPMTQRSAVLCLSFANLTPTVERIAAAHSGSSVTLLCCGQDGEFSLEDFLCAGAAVQALRSRLPLDRAGDAALAAEGLYASHASALAELVATGNHARDLIAAGYASDVATCTQTDTCNVVAPLSHGPDHLRIARL
jgi:2-phosphosulfolactate phosphatase